MACGNESGACEEEEDACVCVCIQGSPLTLCLRRCLAPFSPPPIAACLSLPPSHPSIWPAQLSLPAPAIPRAETAAFSLHPVRKTGWPQILGTYSGESTHTHPPKCGFPLPLPAFSGFLLLSQHLKPCRLHQGQADKRQQQEAAEPPRLPLRPGGLPSPPFRERPPAQVRT